MSDDAYLTITELPAALLTPDQIHRFAHRYGYAHRLARNQRVLEVACGAGEALDYLAQEASWVVGLDYSSGVMSHARHDSHVPLVQGDAQALPIANTQFDLILCFEAIYYLEDYRRFLAECQRVLAPGGRVLICQSNPDWPTFAPGALTTHYPALPELAGATAAAGFGEVNCYGILPITATTPRQRLFNGIRRWVLRSGILPMLGPLKTLLQQLSYGKLHPLPPTIDAQWVEQWQGDPAGTPLSAAQPDRIHRVIYVEGVKLALYGLFYIHLPAW